MNLLLNILVTGQHRLALTWLHWLHIVSLGAFLFFLIRGFHLLKPDHDRYYKFLEWGLVLTISAYLAALVTNSPESKTSVQDLMEPWVFLGLACGAGYSTIKWPGIADLSREQELKPVKVFWRLSPQAGGLLVAALFSMGLLSSGIEDVKQNQTKEIATDSTAVRQTMAMRKENAQLKLTNDRLSAKQDTLIDLVAQVLIVGQSNGLTAQMSAEQGRHREEMIKELARQLKRYQQSNNRRSITTPNTIQARPFQTSQVDTPDSVQIVVLTPDLATNPD
jgi:hypothetical protein